MLYYIVRFATWHNTSRQMRLTGLEFDTYDDTMNCVGLLKKTTNVSGIIVTERKRSSDEITNPGRHFVTKLIWSRNTMKK